MSTDKRAITAKDLTEISILSDPQISPQGNSFVFVSTRINEQKEYQSNLYMQELDKGTKQWTFNDAQNNNACFSPDGNEIVFQSTRTGVSQLWLLKTGGEAKQLTFFKYGATNPHWSKDGKFIIFHAQLAKGDDVQNQAEQSKVERAKELEEKKKQPLIVNRLKYKSDADGYFDDKHEHLVRLDIKSNTFTQLTTAEINHRFEDIAPDGKTLLFSSNFDSDGDYSPYSYLYKYDFTTKAITKLTQQKGLYHQARFSPSGDQVACFGHEYEFKSATQNELLIFDVATNERTCISEHWDMQLGDPLMGDIRLGRASTGPVWCKDEKELYFIGASNGATGLFKSNLTGELKTLYKDHNHVFSFSYAENKHLFILGISTPTNPGDYYLFKEGSELKQLTAGNSKLLNELSLSEPEEIVTTAEDGWQVQGWVMRPYGYEKGKKYPLILEVHGGPHTMYGLTFFHEMQLLAAKGYGVLFTNPRGSYGYGQKFVDAVRTDYGGKDFSDLMTAVDHALDTYDFIDESRLGVTGGSYGGFMTNWIVGHTNRFKAAVTQRSISNWLSFYGVSDIGYHFTKWELGITLMDDPEKLWDFSPLKYAEDVETPLLILHGEQDLRCPMEQAEQLFTKLKVLKKEVEFVRFPNVNHELSRSGDPQLRLERLGHIVRWFDNHL